MNATHTNTSAGTSRTRVRRGALALSLLMSLIVVVGAPGDSQAATQTCPTFSGAGTVGNLTKAAIVEASGLVASRDHSNRFWLHNDSGDSARIFAMTNTGQDRGTVKLGTRPSADFEDIAIGPGPDASKDYLYIGDIGNNGHGRATVRIYRIAEPTPPGAGKTITIADRNIETFVYAYENPTRPGKTWRRNAESLIVDPRTGDLIIFEKQLSKIDGRVDMSWVYRITQNQLVQGKTILAKPKTAVRARVNQEKGPLTGADISTDGKLIIAKNGADTFAWVRGDGQTVFQALAAHPVSRCLAPRSPGEAIAIRPNGNSFLTVTEKRYAPVWEIGVDYDAATPPTTPPPPPPSSGYTCAGRAATIVGTAGDDLLVGTGGVDVIVGLGGNDVIKGRGGGDFICGGAGRDKIIGNGGSDTLYGNDGGDRIVGGSGADFVLGGAGNDRLFGEAGADYLAGARGNDKLYGGDHNDKLFAGVGTDECFGGAGKDTYQACE